MTDPLAFARLLVDAGVPVLACPPGGTTDGFALPTRWQHMTADPRRLAVYRPGYALMAVCGLQGDGRGVDVIDVDPRNGGTWPGVLEALGPGVELPPVLAMASTPSGGLHAFVAAQGVRKGKLTQGVDYQAGVAGDGGRGFVWIAPTVRISKYPPERAGTPWPYEVVAPGSTEAFAAGGSSPSFKRWYEERKTDKTSLSPSRPAGLAYVPGSGRDNDATSYAASLRRRGVEQEEAALLMEARWATYEQPAGDPFPLEDALAKLTTAWRAFEPREEPLTLVGFSEPQRPALRLVEPLGDDPEGFVRPEPESYAYADWHALAAAPPREVEWLVPGIVAVGRGHLVYAPSGQGKSLLMLEWAAELAKAGRRVLYADWENSLEWDVWPRLVAMGYEAADLDGLRFLSFPSFRPLDVDGSALVAQAVEQGVDTVVVDTASRTIKGPENDNDTWNAWDRATGVPLRRAGIGFVRMDHSGKDLERGARGGSAKGTDVDIIWRMETDEGANPITVLLTNEKARTPVPEKEVTFHRLTIPLRHQRVTVSRETVKLQRNEDRLRELWERLDSIGVPELTGYPTAEAMLRGHGLKFDTMNLKAVIQARKLIAQGRMEIPPPWAPGRYGGQDDLQVPGWTG